MKKRRRDPIPLPPMLTTLCAVLFVGVIFFVPPSSPLIIAAFILIAGALSGSIAFLLSRRKVDRVVIPLAVVLFLISNFFAGFNVLNTILLVSFIIGVRLLFQ